MFDCEVFPVHKSQDETMNSSNHTMILLPLAIDPGMFYHNKSNMTWQNNLFDNEEDSALV